MTARDDGVSHAAAEAIARHSYGKLVAYLAQRTRDVAAAEDALSDAKNQDLQGISRDRRTALQA